MYEPCECCGIRPWTDKHHCLVNRSRKHPERDHYFNIERVCRLCHMGQVNGYEHRREFYHRQKAKYGQPFLDWWEALPLKVKPKYE